MRVRLVPGAESVGQGGESGLPFSPSVIGASFDSLLPCLRRSVPPGGWLSLHLARGPSSSSSASRAVPDDDHCGFAKRCQCILRLSVPSLPRTRLGWRFWIFFWPPHHHSGGDVPPRFCSAARPSRAPTCGDRPRGIVSLWDTRIAAPSGRSGRVLSAWLEECPRFYPTLEVGPVEPVCGPALHLRGVSFGRGGARPIP